VAENASGGKKNHETSSPQLAASLEPIRKFKNSIRSQAGYPALLLKSGGTKDRP
jgi:hypothetical protein